MTSARWRRELGELAREFGCAAPERTGGGHYKISHPSGWAVYAASSPGDERRARENTRKDLRRAARAREVHA